MRAIGHGALAETLVDDPLYLWGHFRAFSALELAGLCLGTGLVVLEKLFRVFTG